ncbi:MAG: 30S ribosomal protein S2 [Elusimicrobiota bacterium]
MAAITMKALLEAGVHFGHQTRRWNPKMNKYIFGERNKIHIMDLQKTVKELKKAYKFIRDVSASGKPIVFVGTKKQAVEALQSEAVRCKTFFVTKRWLGGTLTNFNTIRKSVGRLRELENMKTEGIFDLLSKKERSRRLKEMNKLEGDLHGIKEMEMVPGALFVIDPVEERVAVLEARKSCVPVVAVCDSNADPDLVDFCIPGNDDAVRSVRLLASIMADAVIEGRAEAQTVDESQKGIKESAVAGVPEDELARQVDIDAK